MQTLISGIHFSVEFALLPTSEKDMCFQEVSGIEGSIEYDPVNEGGNNTSVLLLPKKPSFGTISLKRSLSLNSTFVKWIEAALYKFEFTPLDLLVSLRDQDSSPTVSWYVAGALPAKWNTTGIDANKSDLVIETLDLKFSYFRRITNKN